MRCFPEILMPSEPDRKPLSGRRPAGKMVAIALASLACSTAVGILGCGNMPPIEDTGGFGPSKTAIIGAAIGIGAGAAGVAILVHHKNHTMKGCIVSGPTGLEVQNHSDSAPFEITGLTADVKVGHIYQLHGSKLKKAKHATGNRTFAVEKVGKDFGTCSIKPQGIASSTSYPGPVVVVAHN